MKDLSKDVNIRCLDYFISELNKRKKRTDKLSYTFPRVNCSPVDINELFRRLKETRLYYVARSWENTPVVEDAVWGFSDPGMRAWDDYEFARREAFHNWPREDFD